MGEMPKIMGLVRPPPKVYLENIDPFAWESYKNGLAAEKLSKQMDISSMFNLDDIDEPEWANLNKRIGDQSS
jgi:hypothetical protein